MPPIRSRKHPTSPRRSLATATLATGLALALPAGAHGEELPDVSQASHLPTVHVDASALSHYKVDRLDTPRFTQSLLDTPQTVQVIDSELMQDQGVQTLTEALRNSPGVGTFYVGENGATSTGDAVRMRGFDASGSIYVDGVRDLGSISRDVFNVEQVEVIKGPASTDFGRTSPSGAINLVSKQPQRDDALSASIAYGSAAQRRGTLDWNRALGQHAALRVNLLAQDGGVPGRDRIRQRRWGIAPTLAFGLDTPTRVYLDLLHLKQDNRPDGGVPTIGLPGYSSPDPSRPALGKAAPVDPSNFYGTDSDRDRVDVDMATVIVEHDVSDTTRLRNTSRWGRTRQDTLLSSFMSSASYVDTPDLNDPATWSIRRLPNFKDETRGIVANQTSVITTLLTGAIEHDLSAGIELSRETLDIGGTGALEGSAWPYANLYHPESDVAGLIIGDTGTRGHGRTTTAAAYLFDTMKLGAHWRLTGGLRLDRYRTHFDATAACGGRRGPDCGGLPEGAVVPSIDARVGGVLRNWKLGVVYKPSAQSSLYIDVATAAEPPGGNNLELSTRANSADNPSFDPQTTRTLEVGAKHELMDGALLLTAALYRTTVDHEVTQDPVDQLYYQTGRKRVQGVELGLVGRISRHWSASAGFTTMRATVLDGQNVAQDGSRDLAYTPRRAVTAWTRYQLPFGLTLGGGARYADGLKRGTDGAVGTPDHTDAYWVFDAMAKLPLGRHLELQLNVYNLLDKAYVAAINKSGYRYTPGTPRSAMLTLNVRF